MKSLLAISICLFISSCTSYYYASLNSDSTELKRGNEDEFIVETDTASISYSFNGENAPIKIEIYNKTNQALYVDWYRSALILDDIATTYKEDDFSGEEDIFSSESGQGLSRRAPENIDRYVELIPPRSKIKYVPLELTGFPFTKIPDKKYSKKYFAKKKGKLVKVQSVEFPEENSPLKFRSYLTLYSGLVADPSRPIIFEHDFYVSSLMKTKKIKPEDVYSVPYQRKNTFYVMKENGQGIAKVGAVMGMVVGAVVVGAIEVAVFGETLSE